jgi:hypothetical protein
VEKSPVIHLTETTGVKEKYLTSYGPEMVAQVAGICNFELRRLPERASLPPTAEAGRDARFRHMKTGNFSNQMRSRRRMI